MVWINIRWVPFNLMNMDMHQFEIKLNLLPNTATAARLHYEAESPLEPYTA